MYVLLFKGPFTMNKTRKSSTETLYKMFFNCTSAVGHNPFMGLSVVGYNKPFFFEQNSIKLHWPDAEPVVGQNPLVILSVVGYNQPFFYAQH